MKIPVGVSNRHVHLKKEDLEILFGKNYELTKKKDINQPGQYASEQLVTIKGPKGEIPNVRILGPIRPYTQIEISKTDSYKLGVNPPIRMSGDLENSDVVEIIGPNGSIVTSGCILAARHIHITYEDMEKYKLKEDKKYVAFIDNEKKTYLGGISIKPSKEAFFELHIDTDEANASLINNGDIVEFYEEK